MSYHVSYNDFCAYRLPCGICTRTNCACPLPKSSTWEVTNVVCITDDEAKKEEE